MILNALIGLSWGKIKQTDEEKSKVIKKLQTALERVKRVYRRKDIIAYLV